MTTLTPAPDLAAVYKAAGDPVRVGLLRLLAFGERCVCDLHAALDLPQPTVSRNLAVLRNAGLVTGRREGAWVFYALTPLAETWLAPALADARADAQLRAQLTPCRSC